MKRLAIIAAIFITVALGGCGGCGGPSAETANREATAFCANHGGVDHINYSAYDDFLDPAYYDAECVDGSEIE